MTLVEQIEYINKVKERIESENLYGFNTFNQLSYSLYYVKTKHQFIEFTQYSDVSEYVQDSMIIGIVNPDSLTYCIICKLEDFLSNYFWDMINPTPEEKVMWKLQFGFDWFF